MVQKETFKNIQDNINKMQVLRDDEDILRIKTKLTHKEDKPLFKLPMLLPHEHPFVDLLIRKIHLEYGHAGIQYTMAKLRDHFWILRAGQAIRKIIVRCVTCIRFSAKECNTVPAALPEKRLKSQGWI